MEFLPHNRLPRAHEIGALLLKTSLAALMTAGVVAVMLVFTGACARATVHAATAEDKADLAQWWRAYKQLFIAADGRVARPQNGNDTVSEGQAYALIYCALLDDRATFDRVRAWTRNHLSRQAKHGDCLLAWHWVDGEVADWNSASDANLDYVLALLLGYRRWSEEQFKEEAVAVASDVLKHETHKNAFGLTLLPGAWGVQEDGACVVNPSYFSPAAFRMLHTLTDDIRWQRLAEVSYTVWEKSGWQLGKTRGIGLPPDWCLLQPDGSVGAVKGRSTRFGWDAVRVPMRAGLDVLLTPAPGGRRYLRNNIVGFFTKDFRRDRPHAAAVYAYWGAPDDPAESLAMSAMALFAFQATGVQPPFTLSYSFDRQRRDRRFTGNYYAQSLLFYPLAYRAGVLKKKFEIGN